MIKLSHCKNCMAKTKTKKGYVYICNRCGHDRRFKYRPKKMIKKISKKAKKISMKIERKNKKVVDEALLGKKKRRKK